MFQSTFQTPRRRAGTSITSYVIVSCICVTMAAGAACLISDSLTSFSQVSQALDQSGSMHDFGQSRDRLNSSRANLNEPETNATQKESLSRFQLGYDVLSIISICLITFLYIRTSHQKVKIEEQLTCRIDTTEQQSEALSHVIQKQEIIDSYFRNDRLHLGSDRVEDIMSMDVETICPATTVKDASFRLQLKGYRRMIVADDQGYLLGVVSKNDIKIRTGETVEDVMSTELKTVSRDMPIATALSIVVKNRISCVPVVDAGRFVGLVSTTDLLIYLQCVLHSTETQKAALASH